jgi:hypothetical protein
MVGVPKDRCCPSCRGDEVVRSRTRNLLERFFKYVLRTVPYRCLQCGRRFFAGRDTLTLAGP